MTVYDVSTRSVGDEISSTYEGRHLSFIESELTHPSHTDGFVDKGDPINVGDIVGVAFKSAAAATDIIAIDSEGVWCLNVVASDDAGTSAVILGDPLYVATGIVSKKASGTPFGKALSALDASATAAAAAVKIHMENPQDELRGTKFNVTMQSFAAADVAKGMFIAPAACKVVSAYEAHGTVAGQAGVLNVEKCTTGEAAGAGDVVLATGWDLTSTINTPVSLAALGTAVVNLVAGDELRLILTSGTAASLDDAVVTVSMQYL